MEKEEDNDPYTDLSDTKFIRSHLELMDESIDQSLRSMDNHFVNRNGKIAGQYMYQEEDSYVNPVNVSRVNQTYGSQQIGNNSYLDDPVNFSGIASIPYEFDEIQQNNVYEDKKPKQ